MPPHDDKRLMRKLKREIKRAGNRQRRQHLKRTLQDPEGAADAEFDYGRNTSANLNGNDRDATRQRHQRPDEEE
jgi:hypothetical protein